MKLLRAIEELVGWLGRAAGLLNLALIALILVDVFLRGVFSLTAAWVIELEWHLFAIIFLLGIPYALQRDRHVRVDLFYEKFRPEDRRKVDLIGTVIFLLPWAFVLLFTGSRYAYASWVAGEGSPNPNGIPYFFPIKSIIPIAAGLLLLQGLASAWRTYRGEDQVTEP